MDNATLMAFDCTDALNELKDFFGEIGEEEAKDPAIVVALRRVIDGVRDDECFVDDPRGRLIVEMLEKFLQPVTTENLLDMVTCLMQFHEMLEESTEETDD